MDEKGGAAQKKPRSAWNSGRGHSFGKVGLGRVELPTSRLSDRSRALTRR
jgi:hypothetical protein